jgi:hypothetical protein
MAARLTPMNILGLVGLVVTLAFLFVFGGLGVASGSPIFWVLGIGLILVWIANFQGRESWAKQVAWLVVLGIVLFAIGHFGGLTYAILAGLFLTVYGLVLLLGRLVGKGGAIAPA